MKNKEQSQEFGEWEIDLPEDPNFRSAVWREIAMRDASSTTNRLRCILEGLLMPRFAIPSAIAALVVVFLGASLHGIQSRQRTWDNLAVVYSTAIDPIAHTEVMLGVATGK